MTTSNKRGIQYESVAEVCDRLAADGCLPEKISLGQIRDVTKTGGLGTIGNHRERWLRERRGPISPLVHIDDGELAELRVAAEHLISKKTDELRAAYEVRAATDRSAIERLELDLEEVLKINDLLQMQYDEALSRSEGLQNDVVAANLRADELAAAIAMLRKGHGMAIVDHRPVVQIPPEPVEDIATEWSAIVGKEAAK